MLIPAQARECSEGIASLIDDKLDAEAKEYLQSLIDNALPFDPVAFVEALRCDFPAQPDTRPLPDD